MYSRPRGLFCLLSVLSLGVPARATAQEGMYVLRPGDRLTVEVFTAAGQRVDVVSGERVLDRDGGVYLPYVGTVHMSGMDETAVRDLLREGFARFYDDPVLTVKVQLRVNVTGAVVRPGQYFLDPTATIVDALAAAGGAASEISINTSSLPADPTAVRLVRDGTTTMLNLFPDAVTSEVLGMHVRSGDWLHVPARSRSRVRDEVTFWSGVVALATSVVALAVLLGN